MSKKSLMMRLSGDAVSDGNMDIDNFIEYMTNFAAVCRETNKIIYPASKLKVSINHKIKKGSFINNIDLAVYGVGLFSTITSNYCPSEILQTLGFLKDSIGLLQLLKFQENKTLTGKIELSDDKVSFEFDSNNSGKEVLTISKQVATCFENNQIRKKLSNFASILEKDGIDSIGFKKKNARKYNFINKTDIKALTYNEELTELEPIINEIYVNIANTPFENLNNKWKFQEGNNEFWATIKDESFLNKVRTEGIKPPFALRVKLKKEQKLDKNNLIVDGEKEVIEVTSFIYPDSQLKID